MPSSFTKGSNLPTPVPVASGGTGVVTSTGSGANVLNTSPVLVTPTLGVSTATSITFGGSGVLATFETGSTSTTFTFNGSGGTSSAVTVRLQRVGDWVTIFIPSALATTGTSSSSFASNTAVASIFRPLTSGQRQIFGAVAQAGGALANPGVFVIGTNGIITAFKDTLGNPWTNATANSGWQDPMVFTYYVGTGS